jgi:hypothetical protein
MSSCLIVAACRPSKLLFRLVFVISSTRLAPIVGTLLMDLSMHSTELALRSKWGLKGSTSVAPAAVLDRDAHAVDGHEIADLLPRNLLDFLLHRLEMQSRMILPRSPKLRACASGCFSASCLATPDSTLSRQECHSPPGSPSKYHYCKQNPDSGGYQSPCANFLAGEADMNMKKMKQHGGGYCRHNNNCKEVPHPKTGWIHAAEQFSLANFSTSRGPCADLGSSHTRQFSAA